MNNICTGSACYSSTSGCDAPCPHEHSSRDTTHTVLPKLNAWPEITLAQRNTVGHSHGQQTNDQKNQSSPHRCVKEWKELNNQPIYDGWLLHKLGLRLSPHTKGWSSAAHSAAKQTCQDDHVIVNIQSYFGKLCCYTNMPMLLVLSLVCSMKTKDWGNILAAIHEKHRRIAYSWKPKQQQV